MTIELAPHRYMIFDHWAIIPCPSRCSHPLFSKVFVAGDAPPRSLPLCSRAGASPATKTKKTTGLPQVAPRDDCPMINYN